MKLYFTIAVLSLVFFTSCKDNTPTQQIDYSDSNSFNEISLDSLLSDTSKVMSVDLPIRFDSTNVLIHPVGFIYLDKVYKNRIPEIKANAKSSLSNDYHKQSHFISNYYPCYFTGNMTNLIFEDIENSGKMHPLTNKVINITCAEYLKDLFKQTKKQYVLYQVQDKDTNKDGKLNSYDITGFYISKLNGEDFEKLSPDYHNLQEGYWVDWCLRYYFKTIEDVNKDGLFNKKDKEHYFYIDFKESPYKLVKYDPMSLIVK